MLDEQDDPSSDIGLPDAYRDKMIEILSFRALNDSDPMVRKHAVFLLGQLKDPGFIDICIQAMRDPEKAVRGQAAQALAEIGTLASDKIIPLLQDPDWKVRYRAAESLGIMKDRRNTEPLIRALSDQKDHVRYMAVKSLGNIGDPAALIPLKASMKDKNHYVRVLASTVFHRHLADKKGRIEDISEI